jgi:MoaA/NifB/PqqE/SkfB family radical SAM enzyme
MKNKVLNYQNSISQLQNKWLHFPQIVSIETMCVCNAKCDFCPQKVLKRKGSKLSFREIEKIVDDLKDSSLEPQFFNLSRANEPFLDPRIFDIAKYILQNFKNSKFNWFTNASLLRAKEIDNLSNIGQTHNLNISLNEYSAKEYEQLMHLKFSDTIQNIELLHSLKEKKQIPYNINLSRVGDNSDRDKMFIEFCKNKFPLFTHAVSNRFDWIGKIATEIYSDIPNCSCSQWFKLHILSDGTVAFCCIDSDGDYGEGNVFNKHIINEIYNSNSWLNLRKKLPNRKKVNICNKCTAFA